MNADKRRREQREEVRVTPRASVVPETAPRLLLLARHGACGTNTFIGATDVPLSEEGRKQAAALAKVVALKKPLRCFCSPMLRCRETAALALAGTQLQPEIENELREINFGRWEGRRFEEIARTDPEAVNRLAKFDRDFAFPGGEAIGAFLARVKGAAKRMSASSEGPVLAFTHAGVITAAICLLLGLSPRKHLAFSTRYAALTSLLVFGNRGVLIGLNESGQAPED